MPEEPRPHVVVIGAGYAGTHAARAASAAGAAVTLVDPSGRHDFAPRLAAVAGGSAGIGDAWAEAEDLLEARIVRGAVTAVHRGRRTVSVGPDVEVAYDALVVTVGADPIVPKLPGVGQGVLTLRSASDALEVRAALEEADELIVVGGGATGVQLAGEAAAAHPELTVHVVERERRLLPGFNRLLGLHAGRLLRRRGVNLHLSSTVAATAPDGIALESGRELSGLVVWAAGFAAEGNGLLPDAPTERGRLVVDRYLRVPGGDPVFAAGDIARHLDLLGRPLRMSAQTARQAGKLAGRNAARWASAAAAGDAAHDARPDLAPAVLVDWGWVIGLGGGAGVAQVGPFPLAGPGADRLVPLLHGAVDLRHLFEIGGLGAVVAHAPGRHAPPPAAIRRAETERASAS